MASSSLPDSKILKLTLTLSNYPILAEKIRSQMRQEIFGKGIIAPTVLEDEVEKKAIATQRLEGLTDPLSQEPEHIWNKRVSRIRDYLTDFYFAYNLPYKRFEEIVAAAVNENSRGEEPEPLILTINPELAPWDMLFAQAEKYASYPPQLYEGIKHHLREIIVVLLKGLISDQLAFIRIARQVFTIFDLKEIKKQRIGRGKIGGKSAGMTLAYAILTRPESDDELDLSRYVTLPETYFIGSDVYYEFQAINHFENFASQKYRSREQIEQEYPEVCAAYQTGRFPEGITDQLRGILIQIGNAPIIVRSSSLLEDNFGSAFAGKYDSFFLPNQGSLEENLAELLEAIKRVYVSVLSPDALFYRQIQGLDDYDERMAVLIQKVQGERYGKYFFPLIGGVGFSRNPFIWNSKIRPEDGFLRIVFGLGTRAVDRVDRDYPRMVGLSHPQLRPESSTADIIKYSQRMMDAIDLEDNSLKTIPITEVLSSNFPGIQYIASVDEGDFVKPIFSLGKIIPPDQFVLTFDNLLKNTDFVLLLKTILKKLERHYERPIDIEFTVQVTSTYPKPSLNICLLQCRPLSNREWQQEVTWPKHVPPEDQLFTANYLVPQGVVDGIKYIVYVDPIRYGHMPDQSRQLELARLVGRLNKRLKDETFILMGPGRWGSSNIDLGVKVTYADIYNSRMLIEIAVAQNGVTPEVSHGTHFFQDLVESNIYPLSLYPDQPETLFNRAFFEAAPNQLAALLPQDGAYADYLKVIDVPQVSQGRYLRVVMNSEEHRALGYLTYDHEAT
jgi:hypothetical protein